MLPTAAVFTDTYLPTVNGVTYTIQTWREQWEGRDGEMPVVYPDGDGYDPAVGEWPVRSMSFPFYEGFNVAMPSVPDELPAADPDLIHAHTPFLLGLSGLNYARQHDLPLVASYHTPTSEYADYIAEGWLRSPVERAARSYEKWYMNRAEMVIVPSEPARHHLREIDVRAPIEVVPNGVDTEQFKPVDTDEFCRTHGLDADRPLVGYTGRHGFEKELDLILDATDGMDVTVVFGGDGPARDRLERRAATADVDVHFLGFLDRGDLPAFYSALDVFAFPSPVETQGLVALEANACGTPVAAVDAGALSDTVRNGENGYRAPPGDVGGFRETIERTLRDREPLRENCLAQRESISVDHAVDALREAYALLE
ncbi:glycosyltransferase [Halorientalis litorea]|uniref:glycosyltransferase n=1 Tax=Halorientalis litorea TaxID=2931977 RepID=UPI001FF37C3B|nr:glycosyltransferase [Halorientalis litorea]